MKRVINYLTFFLTAMLIGSASFIFFSNISSRSPNRLVLQAPTIDVEMEKLSFDDAPVIDVEPEKVPLVNKKPHQDHSKRTVCLVMNDDERQMVQLTHFTESYQIVSFCEMDSNEVATAMMLFYHYWVQEFGDPEKKVLENLNKMIIEWGEDEKVVSKAYTVDGKLVVNAPVIGITHTKNFIWVYRDKQFKIANTSLVHELVHATLWAVHGAPDTDHESTIYKNENYWTRKHTLFIKKVNDVLSSLNM